MRNILPFLSSKPTSSVSSLLTFLQQCKTHKIHLISKVSGNNKHQIRALLKPLRLSRRDRKTLIHDHLNPLSTLIINPDDIFSAIEHDDQQAFPSQICDNCAPGLFKHYGYRVADAGWCSQCHERGECLDVALIEHYRKYGIDDYTIWRYLPRKRYQSNVCPLPLRYQSIDDIERAHQTLFDAFKAQKRLANSTSLAR